MNDDDIDYISKMISEDPDLFNNTVEDMATRLRRYLVVNHQFEEDQISIDEPEGDWDSHADSDKEIWKTRHNAEYGPFVLTFNRAALGQREMGLIISNIEDFLKNTDWKIVNKDVDEHELAIKVALK